MKRLYLILFLCCIPLLFTSCSNDDNCQGIDCLPPATQSGEGTFGCLVNGQAYVDNSGIFNCFYQLVDGQYYFGITAQVDRDDYIQIDIGSLEAPIEIDNDLLLKEREPGNFYAWLQFDCLCPQGKTTSDNPGILEITKFDQVNNIVSATFEFTVVDPNTGTLYEITEGRFDAQFTQ